MNYEEEKKEWERAVTASNIYTMVSNPSYELKRAIEKSVHDWSAKEREAKGSVGYELNKVVLGEALLNYIKSECYDLPEYLLPRLITYVELRKKEREESQKKFKLDREKETIKPQWDQYELNKKKETLNASATQSPVIEIMPSAAL